MRLETRWVAAAACAILTTLAACSTPKPEPSEAQATNPTAAIDRTVLPIQEPSYPPITELDARKVTPPPPSR